MILLQENIVTQYVYLRLTPTQEDTTYLFEFISKENGQSTFMSQNDSSITTNYQKFEFIKDGSNQLQGGYSLNLGEYDYIVYEVPSPTLDKSNAIAKLGIGLLEVVNNGDTKYNLTDNDNFKYYNGI